MVHYGNELLCCKKRRDELLIRREQLVIMGEKGRDRTQRRTQETKKSSFLGNNEEKEREGVPKTVAKTESKTSPFSLGRIDLEKGFVLFGGPEVVSPRSSPPKR